MAQSRKARKGEKTTTTGLVRTMESSRFRAKAAKRNNDRRFYVTSLKGNCALRFRAKCAKRNYGDRLSENHGITSGQRPQGETTTEDFIVTSLKGNCALRSRAKPLSAQRETTATGLVRTWKYVGAKAAKRNNDRKEKGFGCEPRASSSCLFTCFTLLTFCDQSFLCELCAKSVFLIPAVVMLF